MIKCDKGQIWVTGESHQIISECVMIIGHIMSACSEAMGCDEVDVYNFYLQGINRIRKDKA